MSGIGEAALIGAAIGGGTSIVTGNDPLKGALLGGLSGGAMSGIGSALGAGAGAATTTATTGANSALQTGAGLVSTVPGTTGASMLTEALPQVATAIPESLGGMSNVALTQGAGINSLAQNATQQLATQIPNTMTTELTGAGVAGAGGAGATQGGLRDMLGLKPDSLATKGLDWWDKQDTLTKAGIGGIGLLGVNAYMNQPEYTAPEKYKSKLAGYNRDSFTPYEAQPPMPYYHAQYAEGGIAALAGPQGTGNNQNYPQSQMPMGMGAGYEAQTDTYTGEPVGYAAGGMAYMGGDQGYMGMNGQSSNSNGGNGIADMLARQQMGAALPQSTSRAAKFDPAIFRQAQMAQQQPRSASHIYKPHYAEGGGVEGYDLGGYATGGSPRLLSGPGDGMSDSIPAVIGHKQPAKLATGEFVIPADVVSHLGNGSTDAGAKHLYSMMDNIRKARTGNKRQGKQINADRYMPA